MWNFMMGVLGITIGLSFLYGAISRGKSLIKVKIAGIQLPIQLVQVGLSLFVLGLGFYLLLK